MLTELKLSNFRIFDDEVSVRFKPITVLIGRNSSGKSSIIKFLLMLQQSAALGQSRFVNPEGEKVNLGALMALKNALTNKRYLIFDLSMSAPRSLVEPFVSELPLPESGQGDPLRWRVEGRLLYSRRTTRGKALYSLSDSSTGVRLFNFRLQPLEGSSFWDYPSFPNQLNYPASSVGDNGIPESPSSRLARLERTQKLLTQRLAERSIVDTLRYQINSIRHLLPVRTESQRVILASSPPVDDVGQSGEYALPHLQQLASEPSDRYEFIRPHLEKIAGIEAIRFRTSSRYVSQALARSKTTGADVLISDYGFGVSQCLPILVQGAIMAPQTTLMVEQPEAQLHPTAQLELGSFFADLWKQRSVASIIETHSDNILLRLRRLMARGDLSHEDVSVAYFTFDEESNMPTVNNLDINEDGTMQPGLPMEFFGRNVIEGIRMGVRK